jgi:hypothetical protein
MDNMHFDEEIQDKEYFENKIQKLEKRISSLEKFRMDYKNRDNDFYFPEKDPDEQDEVIFLGKRENDEVSVFSTDGKSTTCLSNHMQNDINRPSLETDEGRREFFRDYNEMVLSKEFKEEHARLMKKHYPKFKEKDYFKDICLFDPEGNLIPYHEYIKLYDNLDPKIEEKTEKK